MKRFVSTLGAALSLAAMNATIAQASNGQFAMTLETSYAIDGEGVLHFSGSNHPLGGYSNKDRMTRAPNIDSRVNYIAAGPNLTAAVTDQSTAQVFGWVRTDYNSYGFISEQVPGSGFSQAATGDTFVILLKEDGTVWSFGDNQFGQLGRSPMGGYQSPSNMGQVQLPSDVKVTEIRAAGATAYALTNTGVVYAWGMENCNSYGHSSYQVRIIPGLSNVRRISAGECHLLAQTGDSAYGTSQVFVLGKVSTYSPHDNPLPYGLTSAPLPVEVVELRGKTINDLAAGRMTSAVIADNEIWFWGRDNDTVPGITGGVRQYYSTPYNSQIKAKAISLSYNNAMMLGMNNALFSWGHNNKGELGVGGLRHSMTSPNGDPWRSVTVDPILLTGFGAFQDVPFQSDSWGGWYDPDYEDVSLLVAGAVTNGCGNGMYCPEQIVTRAQTAAFLVRMRGDAQKAIDQHPATADFADVPATHWVYPYAKWLRSIGVTNGCGNNNYCPESGVTRAQFLTMMVRYLDPTQPSPCNTGGATTFTDVPGTHYFCGYIEKAVDMGLISSDEWTFSPDQAMTRLQAARWIANAMRRYPVR